MIDIICLVVNYCIYLCVVNIYTNFINIKEYMEQRTIELHNLDNEILDRDYFETLDGKYELHKPIQINLGKIKYNN